MYQLQLLLHLTYILLQVHGNSAGRIPVATKSIRARARVNADLALALSSTYSHSLNPKGAETSLDLHQGDLSNPNISTVFSRQSFKLLPRLADPTNPDFDLATAILLARFTAIAYCSNPTLLQDWTCDRCKPLSGFQPYRVVWDPAWDLQAYAGYYSPLDAIIVSFRGTDSRGFYNWVENLRTWRTDHAYPFPGNPHALIHTGFYVLWSNSELQPGITQAVGELLKLHPSAGLYVTGHSMGGAVAQLSALDMKILYNISKVHCYSYGAPRVGNQGYQELFNEHLSESWRFTHNRDIVPSVPPELIGFHHVAQEVWSVDVETERGTEMKVLMCDETGEDPSCHNSACYLGLCTSIADHLTYLGVHMYQDGPQC